MKSRNDGFELNGNYHERRITGNNARTSKSDFVLKKSSLVLTKINLPSYQLGNE